MRHISKYQEENLENMARVTLYTFLGIGLAALFVNLLGRINALIPVVVLLTFFILGVGFSADEFLNNAHGRNFIRKIKKYYANTNS